MPQSGRWPRAVRCGRFDAAEAPGTASDYSGDHGTPEQRDDWFEQGYQGDIESCLGNR